MYRRSRSRGPAFHTSRRRLSKPPLIPSLMLCVCCLLALALVVSLRSLGMREPEAVSPSSQGETGESSSLQAGAPVQDDPLPQENSALKKQTESTASPPLDFTAGSSSPEEEGMTEEKASIALNALRSTFPEGKYWNHMGLEDWDEFTVTDIPCQHDVYWDSYCNSYTGGIQELFPQFDPMEQCLGFAALLSDLVFGADAPVTTFTDYYQLRVGDHIRLELSEHSMTVLTVDTDGITVVECNSDYEHCRISWDRFLSWDDLSAYSYEILCSTRYEDGAF